MYLTQCLVPIKKQILDGFDLAATSGCSLDLLKKKISVTMKNYDFYLITSFSKVEEPNFELWVIFIQQRQRNLISFLSVNGASNLCLSLGWTFHVKIFTIFQENMLAIACELQGSVFATYEIFFMLIQSG